MRKLSREAVIFMLLGMLLSAVVTFLYLHHSQAKEIQVQLDQLKRDCDSMPSWAAGTSVPIGSYEHGHSREECHSVFGASWQKLHPYTLPPLPPGATLTSPPNKTTDPWAVVSITPGAQFAPRINLSIDNLANIFSSMVAGGFGFVGGFGVWIFYRLLRFAVKG